MNNNEPGYTYILTNPSFLEDWLKIGNSSRLVLGMAQIKSEAAYRAAMKRIDELLKVVNDLTPADDPNYLELDMISDMVAEYEDIHYPISKPTLIDVIKLRLYEMGITQTKLAEMLGLSNARVSEIMNGKSEPSLKIGRELSR